MENVETILNQLSKDLKIKSLNKNIDKLREFLASLDGKISVILLTESWCDETGNGNSLLRLEKLLFIASNWEKSKRWRNACLYSQKQVLRQETTLISLMMK